MKRVVFWAWTWAACGGLGCDAVEVPRSPQIVAVSHAEAEGEDRVTARFALFDVEGALVPVTVSLCEGGASCLAGACRALEALDGLSQGRIVARGDGRLHRLIWSPACEPVPAVSGAVSFCFQPEDGVALEGPSFELGSLGLGGASCAR